jgi:hypothetical protein
MSNDFSYKDLDEGEFRLLTISSVGGLLTCTLEHVLVEGAPPYCCAQVEMEVTDCLF